MSALPHDVVELRYRRAKAFGFGGMMLVIGGIGAWVGWDALSPGWTSPTDDGVLLQALPPWLRMTVFAAFAALMLVPGSLMLIAGIARQIIVRADRGGISSRTIFGHRRSLAWSEIASAKRSDGENRIVLSPSGLCGIFDEIWDRKSVIIDSGMLEQTADQVEDVIKRFRPDLPIARDQR